MKSTFKFNKIYIIESIDENEEDLTGKQLEDDIIHWKKFSNKTLQSEYLEVKSKDDFFHRLNHIKSECENKQVYPIIHLEIHGSSDKSGLVTKNGQLIKWTDLYHHLIDINSAVGNNLFLTLAVCHGAYLLELIKINNAAPFWGFKGSFDKIYAPDLLARYVGFYDEFLTSFKLGKAIERLEKANPNLPSSYRYINSEETFGKVYQDYLDERFTQKELKQRPKDAISEEGIHLKNRRERRNLEHNFTKQLLRTKKDYLRKHKKIFFMVDAYPENDERFKINVKIPK